MARAAGARTVGCSLATLSVEGRPCSVRAHPASSLGTVSGLAVVADSPRGVRDAISWMPGRVLVLTEEAAQVDLLVDLLADPRAGGFAAVVLLTEQADVASEPRWRAAVPVVLVSRGPDQEWVRRAVRLTLEVHDRAEDEVTIPAPRHHSHRHHRMWRTAARGHRMPGTIDLPTS